MDTCYRCDDAIRMQIIQWERKGGIYHFSLEKEEGRLEKTLS